MGNVFKAAANLSIHLDDAMRNINGCTLFYSHVTCINRFWHALKCFLVKANRTKKKLQHCNNSVMQVQCFGTKQMICPIWSPKILLCSDVLAITIKSFKCHLNHFFSVTICSYTIAFLTGVFNGFSNPFYGCWKFTRVISQKWEGEKKF